MVVARHPRREPSELVEPGDGDGVSEYYHNVVGTGGPAVACGEGEKKDHHE